MFVQHCQDEWQADYIVFLFPHRYREIGNSINVSTMRIGSVRQDLQSSTFYFQGKEKVTQPSILQTYIRTEKAEEGLGGSNSNKATLVGH